jgi:hypothetical protein
MPSSSLPILKLLLLLYSPLLLAAHHKKKERKLRDRVSKNLLFVLLLALLLKDRTCDAVQIPLAVLADPATAPGVLLEDTDLLETLEDVTLNRACMKKKGK